MPRTARVTLPDGRTASLSVPTAPLDPPAAWRVSPPEVGDDEVLRMLALDATPDALTGYHPDTLAACAAAAATSLGGSVASVDPPRHRAAPGAVQ